MSALGFMNRHGQSRSDQNSAAGKCISLLFLLLFFLLMLCGRHRAERRAAEEG
jgi:hypothetical protein